MSRGSYHPAPVAGELDLVVRSNDGRPGCMTRGDLSPGEAVVAPEGTVLGLISLEDLIETVVGSISDEFDPETEDES